MDLSIASKNDYKQICALYNRAFPKDERAPFRVLKRRIRQNKAQLLVAKQEDIFVGFAYTVCNSDLIYLFYLAVDEGCRGKGYGGKILQEIKRQYCDKRIFIAREQLDKSADNYEERVNRHNFYLHNGFEDLSLKIKEASVTYDVMSVGGNVRADEYINLVHNWSGKFILNFIEMTAFEETLNENI